MTDLAPETVAAWTNLMSASRHMLERIEAALKAAGLPPLAWYDALLEIERCGEEGLRPFELTERLLLPQYGTSRLLDRIETAGLVARAPCDGDGRGHLVRITEAGRAMRRRMWPVYAAVLRAGIEDRLDPDDRRRIADLAGRVRRSDRD